MIAQIIPLDQVLLGNYFMVLAENPLCDKVLLMVFMAVRMRMSV